ncbi:MAG: prepilin-type N-terminal cleavage/methylation domain-containing protein [Candidatus Omnitrophota bacterium]
MRLSIIKTFKKRSNNGFTLIEILLAIGIAAFTICAILATYISCFALIETAKNINIATNAASGLMEDIRATPFNGVNSFNGVNFIVNNIPASRGVVSIADVTPAGWPSATFLEATISVCWNQRNRIMGEDANLNGALDAGEDANGNGTIDSPVQLTTRIAQR